MGHEFYEIEGNQIVDEYKEKVKEYINKTQLPSWLEPITKDTLREELKKAKEYQDDKCLVAEARFELLTHEAPDELKEAIDEWYDKRQYVFDGYHVNFRMWEVSVRFENDEISDIMIGADAHV